MLHRHLSDLLIGAPRARSFISLVMRLVCAGLVALSVSAIAGAVRADDFTVTNAGELEVRGMDCVPQVKQVETRRPIPILCQTDTEVAGVELRYRFEGSGKKWDKVSFKQSEAGWTGTIPCAVTGRKGTLKVYIFARNEARKVVARVGRNTSPMEIKLVEQTKEPPPALPNKEAPDRCFDKSECPPEMIGTAACPGTKAEAASVTKRAWGASCTESSQCASGLACVAGSCENPPKCEKTEDCPTGGECTDEVCHFPTQEELDSRLGPPKHHWFGLHFAADLAVLREAVAVCHPSTEDGGNYDCFKGGEEYTGTPNRINAGNAASGFHLATMRALVSYDYFFKRFAVGGRLGWAFRGAPKGFTPIHIEARGLYSLRQDPLNNRFRPYLGLSAGYAQVDAPVAVSVVDCVEADPTARAACEQDVNLGSINARVASVPPTAIRRTYNAYYHGGKIFFGPSLMMMFAFSNEAALVFNLNTMFPNVVFQPSLGYVMGI